MLAVAGGPVDSHALKRSFPTFHLVFNNSGAGEEFAPQMMQNGALFIAHSNQPPILSFNVTFFVR